MDPRIKIRDTSENYTLKIVSFKDYDIYLDNTVFGGVRLKPYLKDENGINWGVSEKDWCAGDKKSNIIHLLNVMLQIIDEDELDNYPESSKIKPYINDTEVLEKIKNKTKIYLTEDEIEINNKNLFEKIMIEKKKTNNL